MKSRRFRLMQVWVLAGGEEEDGWIEVAIYRSNGVVGRTRVRRARVYWYLRLVGLMTPLPEEWVRMDDGPGEPLGVVLLRELVGEVRGLREEVAGLVGPSVRMRLGPEGMSVERRAGGRLGEIAEELKRLREEVAGLRAERGEARQIRIMEATDWGPIVETLREMGWG